MPAFLVTVPDVGGQTLLDGSNRAVVFATDATDALAIAKTFSASDMDTAWTSAMATEIVAGTDFSAYALRVAVQGASPQIDVSAVATGIAAFAPVIATAGTGYVAGEIVTLVGGTFTRAGTVRIVTAGSGIPSVVEMVDPGDYTVVPTATNNAVTGGSGSGLLLDISAAANRFDSMIGKAVTLLNADAQIAGAAADMGAGSAPLLTAAAIGDALGDLVLVVEFKTLGVAVPSYVGTIVDQGVSGAVLTVELAVAPIVGNAVAKMKA